MPTNRLHRSRGSAAAATILAVATAAALVGCATPPARLQTPGSEMTHGHPDGIWKAAVPPRPMHGEFEDFDPIGIEGGARIKADCSLNWTNPDDGRLYCFASGTSLEVFLEAPRRHLERALRAWRRMRRLPR